MIRQRALLAAREMALPLFLAGTSVLVTGMGVLWGNQSIQAALVHWINDPSLYPDDPFAGTLPRYAALLWWGVAGAARLCSLELLLAALFLLQRVLLSDGCSGPPC
jgi:hypothetical protein